MRALREERLRRWSGTRSGSAGAAHAALSVGRQATPCRSAPNSAALSNTARFLPVNVGAAGSTNMRVDRTAVYPDAARRRTPVAASSRDIPRAKSPE